MSEAKKLEAGRQRRNCTALCQAVQFPSSGVDSCTDVDRSVQPRSRPAHHTLDSECFHNKKFHCTIIIITSERFIISSSCSIELHITSLFPS